MDQTNDINLLAAFKKLLAESKSQEARLEDYAKIIYNRDNEIAMLQAMLNEANENRSSMDEQVKKLKDLQSFMNDLQQQSLGAVYSVTGSKKSNLQNVSIEQQFKNLQQDYAYLQMQLTDMQIQLLDANNRNTILQLNASRVAELESLLENEQAREGVKQKE
jgi:hypothetical protein